MLGKAKKFRFASLDREASFHSARYKLFIHYVHKENTIDTIKGTVTGRIRSKNAVIQEMHKSGLPREDCGVCVIDGDFSRIEAIALAHMIEDTPEGVIIIEDNREDIMGSCNVANKVARLVYNNVVMATLSIQPQVFEDRMGVKHVFYRGNQHPIPKTMNARQAWKKRGKTSKRKGTRK